MAKKTVCEEKKVYGWGMRFYAEAKDGLLSFPHVIGDNITYNSFPGGVEVMGYKSKGSAIYAAECYAVAEAESNEGFTCTETEIGILDIRDRNGDRIANLYLTAERVKEYKEIEEDEEELQPERYYEMEL